MFSGKAIIRNEAGIHCRPSAVLVNKGTAYAGVINVIAEGGTCDLSSALEVLMLCLHEGDEVTIEVRGPDEEAFGAELVTLFETHFDFPPK